MSASDPPTSLHYAESAAISAVTEDLTAEVGFRLGRFPGQRTASLWSRAQLGDLGLSVSETTPLGPGAGPTRFDGRAVVYEETGDFELRLERAAADRRPFIATAHVAAKAQATADPTPGAGVIPFLVDLRFQALHPPVQVKPERLEVFGTVEATVRTDTRQLTFTAPGKLHEQRGPRERFAPAFTYLGVVGRQAGLLAVDHGGGAYGYAWLNGEITPVESVWIAPPGPARRFDVVLAGGGRVVGVAELVRASSDIVEGKRRPGSTVVARTPFGPMVGQLNDWLPDP
jgi:hypothetical protein